jgi:hypothetical protein
VNRRARGHPRALFAYDGFSVASVRRGAGCISRSTPGCLTHREGRGNTPAALIWCVGLGLLSFSQEPGTGVARRSLICNAPGLAKMDAYRLSCFSHFRATTWNMADIVLCRRALPMSRFARIPARVRERQPFPNAHRHHAPCCLVRLHYCLAWCIYPQSLKSKHEFAVRMSN